MKEIYIMKESNLKDFVSTLSEEEDIKSLFTSFFTRNGERYVAVRLMSEEEQEEHFASSGIIDLRDVFEKYKNDTDRSTT